MKNNYDILVIDDEKVVIDSVVKVGESQGYRVDSAQTANSALSRLNSQSYKMIICDVMMPEMDGFQFLREIRRIGIDTPVIMTTGLSTLQNAVKSLLSGAIGFLPKPFTPHALIDRVQEILLNRDLADEAAAQAGVDGEPDQLVELACQSVEEPGCAGSSTGCYAPSDAASPTATPASMQQRP